jgi:sugar phosphate permease
MLLAVELLVRLPLAVAAAFVVLAVVMVLVHWEQEGGWPPS